MKPIRTTRKMLAATAAERWRRQYPPSTFFDGDREETYDRLIGLGSAPSPEDVDRVIGNDTWTRDTCTSCGDCDVGAWTEVGGEDYVTLCDACLEEAARLIGMVRP